MSYKIASPFFFFCVNRRDISHFKNNWSLHYSYILANRYMYYKYTSNTNILVNICIIYLLGTTKEQMMSQSSHSL